MSDTPYEPRPDDPVDPDRPTADPGTTDVPEQAPDTAADGVSTDYPAPAGPPATSSAPHPGSGTHHPPPPTTTDGAPTSTFDVREAPTPPPTTAADETPTSTFDVRETPAPPPPTTEETPTSTFEAREADRVGNHQAQRPVPRSGLSEYESAGYLTGDRAPAQPEPGPGSQEAAPWVAGGAAAGAGAATSRSPEYEHTDHQPSTAAVLDGATVTAKPRSRAGAHVWAVVLTLLLTPVAWYLLAGAGARLTLPARSPWETGNINVAALLELGGGLLVLAVVLLAARWSSLGAIITGSLVLVLGVPFVAVPAWTQEILGGVTDWLQGLGDFGSNVAHHLVASGSTGRLVVYGLALIFIGVVSHGARRQGRRQERLLATA